MKVFVLILLTLFASCSVEQINVPQPTPTPVSPVPITESVPPEPPLEEKKPQIIQNTPRTIGLVEEKFENYLINHEIKPLLTIENDYNGARQDRTQKVKISNHTITWFHSIEIINKSTIETLKIKIDDNLISLKDKESLNDAGDGKINGDFVNDWDKIKLYNIKGRELIGIEIRQNFCTGLACSVTFFLVYDLKTKNSNFFGDFRVDNRMKLYDFEKNGTIDFLATEIDNAYSSGLEITRTYNSYTLDKKGIFQLQNDKNKKPYFIKRVFISDDDSEIDDKFEQKWVEKIK